MPTLRQAVPCGHDGLLRARVATRLYPAVGESVPQARQFVSVTLFAWGLSEAADAAALVTSELAANAARHGGGTTSPEILIRLYRAGPAAVIEVGDHDPSGLPRPSRMPGPDDERGRGLLVVAALAEQIGWHWDGGWKIVWATVRLPRPRARRGTGPPLLRLGFCARPPESA